MRNLRSIPRNLVLLAVFVAVLSVMLLIPAPEASACCWCPKLKPVDPCATIYVVHQTPEGILLKPQEVHVIKAGCYGPYWAETFSGYGPGVLAPRSSPASGTIKAGQAICITYHYVKNQYGTVIVTHMDADTNAILKQTTYKVPKGSYGPYYAESFANYEAGYLRPGSDLPSGTIISDGLKTIYFVYKKKQTNININVQVIWDDFNNRYNTRPGSVGVQLMQNGNYIPFDTRWVLTTVNYCTFTAPYSYANGTPYVYTTNLTALVDGYDTVITGSAASGFIIYNTLKRQMNIEITVEWRDYNNFLGRRPGTITVGIFRNGAPYQMQAVNVPASGNQPLIYFNNVDRFDAAGNMYTYTVVQQPLNAAYYVTTIIGRTIVNELII